MNRLLFAILLSILSFNLQAQSSITLSVDNNLLFTLGGQLKYTHDFDRTQVGAYFSVNHFLLADGGFPILRYGLTLNTVPAQKPLAMYFGGSVEYATLKNASIIYKDTYYTDQIIVGGPQAGMKWRTGKHISLLFEWGIRIGAIRYSDDYRSPGGATGKLLVTDFMLFIPANVGISYTFGKPKAALITD